MPAGVSAYVALANVTLGSSVSTVTFSSIVGTYRDLVLVINGFTSAGGEGFIQFNGDSGGNYNSVRMYGTGSSTGSDSQSSANRAQIGNIGASNSVSIIQIMDYIATDKHKTVLSRANTSSEVFALAARWANTAAVTSFQLALQSGTFSAGCTVALYGIAS